MADIGFRNRSVSQSRFAMIPRADIPRSTFVTEFTHKTTFDAGLIVPVYLEEILPGDSFRVDMTAFARMSTPLFPVMDNFHLDSFFFFVPNRLVWENWPALMGEKSPAGSTDYTVPQAELASPPAPCSVWDYFGIPTVNQVDAGFSVNALPMRAYALIYEEWFRDQNLVAANPGERGDGPDPFLGDELPYRRGKRHDYFTSALPWPQAGDPVHIGIASGSLAVLPSGDRMPTINLGGVTSPEYIHSELGALEYGDAGPGGWSGNVQWIDPKLEVDLGEATAVTINALRSAIQMQRLLERDARGGSRYTELLMAHFGVRPEDSRLQRPEYLGGGTSAVNISPVAQTSATGSAPGDTPLGALGAVGTSVARHGFSGSFTEHGFVVGVVSIRADLTYQQGLARMWSRETRYDYYWPVFAHLGEQPILRKELYFTGVPEDDDEVFGYQERWSEYRYHPSQISGLFRSYADINLDEWHAAQWFEESPSLNQTFIEERPPMSRILAAGAQAVNQQFLFDSVFSVRMTRAMPTYSVPGFLDRF